MDKIETKWTKIAADMLVGKRIKAVGYMTKDEAKSHEWYERAILIELEDGTLLYPSSDDEGNSAGSIFTTNEKQPVLPVIPLN